MDELDSSSVQEQSSEFGSMGLRLRGFGDDVRGKADFFLLALLQLSYCLVVR